MTRSFHDLIGQLRQDSNTACQSHEYKRSKFTPCTRGGTWRKWQEEEGRKLERTGALAGHRHGFISEIKMDVVNIGTIAVNTTSETHIAAKAVSRDASYCVHHEMCSMTENMSFAGMRIPMLFIQNGFAVHVTEHLRHACLPHVVFLSTLMFFFHVLLSLHVRELFYLVNNAPRDPNIYWGLCKLYVWQSSREVSGCRDTPLFIHTSAWVVSHSSNQRLYNGTMPNLPTLSVSVLPCLCFQGHRTQKRHPLIFHLRLEIQDKCFLISKGGIYQSDKKADGVMCVSKQTGVIWALSLKESVQVLDCLRQGVL